MLAFLFKFHIFACHSHIIFVFYFFFLSQLLGEYWNNLIPFFSNSNSFFCSILKRIHNKDSYFRYYKKSWNPLLIPKLLIKILIRKKICFLKICTINPNSKLQPLTIFFGSLGHYLTKVMLIWHIECQSIQLQIFSIIITLILQQL